MLQKAQNSQVCSNKSSDIQSPRPQIGPKPVIASKPRHIPPIATKKTGIPPRSSSEVAKQSNILTSNRDQLPRERHPRPIDYKVTDLSKNNDIDDKCIPTYSISFTHPTDVTKGENENVKTSNYIITQTNDAKKPNKTSNDKNNQGQSQPDSKDNSGSSSPSTVCCSILPTTSASDCCGVLSNSAYKKEVNSQKSMTTESADSVSSDSGGFKEFILRDSELKRLEAEQNKAASVQNLPLTNKQYVPLNHQQHYYSQQIYQENQEFQEADPMSRQCPIQFNQLENVPKSILDEQYQQKIHLEHQQLLLQKAQRQQLHEQTKQLIQQTKEMSQHLEYKIQQMNPLGQTQLLTKQFQQQWNQQSQELNQQLQQLQQHTHTRKISQPDFLSNTEKASQSQQHQRKISQPEFFEQTVAERAQLLKQSITHQRQKSQSETLPQDLRQIVGQNRQVFASNQANPAPIPKPARAKPPVPHQEQNVSSATCLRPGAGILTTATTTIPTATTESSKTSSQLISQSQFKQSTKKLEELLAQRAEKEKQLKLRKGGVVLAGDGAESSATDAVHRQIQQKLQADLKQHVKQIQELQSTELRLPQNRPWNNESNRSQPAIGLKHTPKSRPTIFGTVASDQTPKDGANRRSLPQTPQSSKNFSALYNGSGENGSGANIENLSESEFSADNALVYRDGNLVSGSLEALIQHMVPTNQYYPDRAYLFAFLLSSRLYIKPHELLARICTLCDNQQRLKDSLLTGTNTTAIDGHAKIESCSVTAIAPPAAFAEGHNNCETSAAPANSLQFTTYLIQLLAEWTETFPYDFRDERVMQHVRNISQKCVALNPVLCRDVSSLLQNLLQRLTTLENYEEFLQKLSTTEQENDNNIDITEICPDAGVLAQQLTHIELERLSYIGPEEFVQAFAKENPHLETSFKDMKKTKNLESYVQWFNRLSYFVATEVCKHPKKKQRVKVVEFWIETAQKCFNIGNFNSLMAIIAGLNMSPISRLKKTWSKIHSGKFSILEHQMDPTSNFSSYRSTLKAAMWRSAGARDERQRIVIPFFSLLVKDLYFLNEGCSNKLPNGHINFEKFWQLAKQVTEFMAWKQVTCPFEKNPRVITLLQTNTVLSENALALASFECEQPENNQERERYKSLKAEANNS